MPVPLYSSDPSQSNRHLSQQLTGNRPLISLPAFQTDGISDPVQRTVTRNESATDAALEIGIERDAAVTQRDQFEQQLRQHHDQWMAERQEFRNEIASLTVTVSILNANLYAQNARISTLEQDNKILEQDNKILKQDIKILKAGLQSLENVVFRKLNDLQGQLEQNARNQQTMRQQMASSRHILSVDPSTVQLSRINASILSNQSDSKLRFSEVNYQAKPIFSM